jgi:hypothetical protein
MSVGTVTLSTLTQMVRAITRHYTAVTFSDSEVENALNAAQGKAYIALPAGVKRALYGSMSDLTVAESNGLYTATLPSTAWDVTAVRLYYTVSSVDYTKPMFQADLDFVLAVSDNDYRQGIYWVRHGGSLYFSEGITVSGADESSEKARVFTLTRPVDMDIDNDFDLPDEYRRYVVLMAALDLLSFASNVPNDAIASARQEVVVEAKSLGLYPDIQAGMAMFDAKASSKDEEPLRAEGR